MYLNSFKTGVMWADFLVKVTKPAAAFWIRWRRANWSWGSPNKRELSISSREVTKLWTICSVAQGFKYFLIPPIFLMWKDTERTILDIWIWWFRDKDESKMTPKLRAFVAGLMSESLIVIWETLGRIHKNEQLLDLALTGLLPESICFNHNSNC